MGKRSGFLMDSIADPDNLRLAFWKSRKGKEDKPETIEFSENLDANLLRLRNNLIEGTTEVGNYHYFTIYDPKERVICAAPFGQRVLHHAIMNICHPIFEKFQIPDSYATRVGKGQYAALERAKFHSGKYRWFCKLDVRKYFDSIDHKVLYTLLERKFKDQHLLNLFYKIIKSYETLPDKGLPIGNLTSQYFANFYLAYTDHYIKETLHVKAYVRYMDDMVLWSNDKDSLLEAVKQINGFILDVLKMNLKPVCINKVENGLPFLGYVINNETVRLNKNSKKRFTRKMNLYYSNLKNESWSQTEFVRHIVPLIAFTRYAACFGLRKEVIKQMEAGLKARTA